MRTPIHGRGRARVNCLTSALMALEAWAHHRIEAEEDFEAVFADILGPPGSPAAYLLVAADLILALAEIPRGSNTVFSRVPNSCVSIVSV